MIVELKNLTKTYTSGDDILLILDDINFTFPRGALMSLTGESGSGKSTFLNIVGALDKADSGEIKSCGVSLHRADENTMAEYRNKNTGFIFQFHYLLKDFNALENIMLPGRIQGQNLSELRMKAQDLLKSVNMENRSHHYPGQLSGGERQRIALARALINSPQLILADEPTGSLDEKNSRLVEDMLFSLTSEKGVSLILATHDRQLASRTTLKYHLQGGQLNAL
ncbi:ABC transporter ATP-binding protein [Oceanispirochaeta sp.]|jgi:lipoprotein-releasing system ATP-binding protein|uniref:ABC transporter ATP-binding protein n=1 Tax=Oceanispirochaeta sp. TaxID=2035350 RepID=UPI0026251E3E|nr:ABC transporter ATP-binding protein [Oceanispirochaeta sp.]MDA3955897.1 ABC transporter ATP-binding protein [Oceanispirochaeta sp.]